MSLASILSYGGLALFAFVVIADVLALLVDVYLLAVQRPTISARAWLDPSLCVGLVGWQVIGVVALTIHLVICPY